MGQNMPHEHLLRVEVDRGNQPVFVATDVKHVERLLAYWDVIHATERPL